MQLNPQQQEEFNKDAHRIKAELDNQNSVLFIFLQSLILEREKMIQKNKMAADSNALWKGQGMVEGLDMAIDLPYKIVKRWEDQTANKHKEEMENIYHDGAY